MQRFNIHSNLVCWMGCIDLLFLSLTSISQELKDTLAMELDFENEGQNQEKCARQLQHMPFVHVPTVEWGLTTKVSIFFLSASKIARMLFFAERDVH